MLALGKPFPVAVREIVPDSLVLRRITMALPFQVFRVLLLYGSGFLRFALKTVLILRFGVFCSNQIESV